MLQEQLLALLRCSIHGSNERVLQEQPVEWEELLSATKQQMVLGLTLDGLVSLKMSKANTQAVTPVPDRTFAKWYGEAEKDRIARAENKEAIAELAGFYSQHGIHMMLLKGYGISLYWPKPEARISGDIDMYLFDDQGDAWKRGDALVEEKLGKVVSADSEHHTKFTYKGISVENHYDFVNTKIRRSSVQIEKVFKSLAQDHSKSILVDGQEVYVPSDKLNAIFLLRHLSGHFASEGLSFRQILDWAFFASKTSIDWDWLYSVAREFNMHRFLSCLNCICVDNLGFDAELLPVRFIDKDLQAKVLHEILCPLDLVPNASVVNKVSRWWKHRWKHRICYSDSLLSSFYTSVTANLFDKTIKG